MSEHIRRVASPEGAQYYGLPIGAPITADAKAAAKLKHGGLAEPSGASKKSVNRGGSAKAASSAKESIAKAASAPAPKSPQTKTKVKKPSIKGNLHFKVGQSDYTAPNGSKLFHQKGVDGLAYVKTPDGKVHIFNANGEVETDSKAILQALSQKFSQDIGPDDADFEPVEFDKAGAHFSLDQMPVGGVLTDQRGNPVFTKNEDGSWHNEDLGVDLDEKSVKPLFDSGDLVPESTPGTDAVSNALADKQAVNLSELSFDEAAAALDAMPEGTSLSVEDVILTKQSDGWKSSKTGNVMPSSQAAYLKSALKPADGAQVTPDQAADPKGAPAPKTATPDVPAVSEAPKNSADVTDRAAASKQAIADANPYKPQPVNWETTYPGDQQYPKKTTDKDLDSAQPGDTVLAAYYNEDSGTDLNDYYDIAVFTKQDDGTWWDQDSIQKLSDLEMGDLAQDPEVGLYSNKDNKGPEIARAKAKEARKKAQEEAIKAATSKNFDAPKKLNNPAEQGAPEGMVPGGSLKGDLANYPEGHKVALKFNGKTGKGLASKTVYTKTGPDTWHQDGDPTTFGDKNSQWLKGQKNKSTSLVHEAYASDEEPAAPETQAVEEPKATDLQTGDKPTKEWVNQAEAGSQILYTSSFDGKTTIWEKNSDGDWVSGSGDVFEKDIFSDVISTPSINASIISNGKTQAVKDAEALATPAAPDHMQVGGKPETVDHLKDYAEGTTLSYLKKDGKTSTYIKLGNGSYLTPGGQVMPPEKFKSAVKTGKFTVASVPAQVQAPEVDAPNVDEQYLVPNAQIDKFGVLNKYRIGTTIKESGGPSYNGIPLVKMEDGWHSEHYGTYSTDTLEEALKQGDLYFVSSPKTKVDATSPDAPDVHSTAKDITFDNSGQAFSAAELKQAHDALEAHSGPQISYGLKSVPDNVFSGDKAMQDKLKAWGKTAYPDLPPKQAALNVLKDKLGLKKDTPVAEKNSDAPEISFGAQGDSIKNTATGLTGGAYSAADVEDAISILEGFNGKNFKSELNKKSNPLGALSPNDLVGFNKDKTITKQKFIDLMKQKLDDHKAAQVQEGGPVTEEPLSLDGPQVGEKFTATIEQMDAMKVGSVVTVGKMLYTKQDNGKWEAHQSDGFKFEYPAAAFDGIDVKYKSEGDGSVAKSPEAPIPAVVNEAAKDGPSVGSVVDKNDIPDMAVGTVIMSQIGKKYTKVGFDQWEKEGELGDTFSDKEIKYLSTPNLFYSHIPDAAEAADEKQGPDLVPGEHFQGGESDYASLPEGTVLVESVEDGFAEDNFWTKKGDDYWENQKGESLNDGDLAQYEPDSGYLVSSAANQDHANAPTDMDLQEAGVSGVKAGDPMKDAAELDSMPSGTKVQNSYGYEFTKESDGSWDSDGEIYSSTDLEQALVENGVPYHYTFVPEQNAAPLDTESHLTHDDIESADIGDVITWHTTYGPYTEDYKKTGDDEWQADSGITLDNSALTDSLDQGGPYYTWSSKVNPVPHHADAPNAVKSKDHDDATLSGTDVPNNSVGTVYAHTDGTTMYVKQGDDHWVAYNKQTGEEEFYSSDKSIAQGIDSGDIQNVTYDGPEYNKSGLMPGKYSSGGAAYMVVHADGTGTYVNGKGVASKMTSYKVKKNHESGMAYYQGIPDTVPPVAEAPKTGPKAKPAKLGKADLPDGTYFAGNPDDPKTALYHVEGDKVTIQKSINSTVGSAKKVGQDADLNWYNSAVLGAQVKSQTSAYGYGEMDKTFTKTTDGWVAEDGSKIDMSQWENNSYMPLYSTIMSHGFGTTEETTALKLQNLAKKGQITDKYGNSITPAGYTGEVYFLGSKTSITNLAVLQKAMADDPNFQVGDAKNYGVFINNHSTAAAAYIKDTQGSLGYQSVKPAVQKKIADMLQNVDMDLPESDAADLFTYNALGQPMPPKQVGQPVGWKANDKKNLVKEIGAEFGGGGIIGQHTEGMTGDQASDWLTAFNSGDFASMYSIEVDAAAKKGKSHVAGFKHPGFGGNAETNKVAWAAAVDGEVSAGEKVPGDWTPNYGNTPSMDEVNNYLIAAQMQNPTYLTDDEKRVWVIHHKNGTKSQTDSLSLIAQQRKVNGEKPKSDPISWTDDLKPAKSYDKLFENKNEFPTSWSMTQALDYLGDNKDLESQWTEQQGKGYISAPQFLGQHFQSLKDEADAKAKIPVYTKDAQQTVKKSTHPIYNYHDQFGNKYYFKPRADTKEDKYRTEAEHLGNTLGRALGFKTAKSDLLTINGQYGQMQQDVGGVSDFSGFNFKTLTAKQIADIEGEHLLDYFMNNDDAKYDNVKIQADGSVIGIDKARSFGFYGQWDWEGSAADGNTTIYQNMYKAIRNGSFSKEDLDKAYLKARLHALRISKFDEERLRTMMQEGMKNRTTYNVPYSINGKKVSQDFDGLMAAVMDRKAQLPAIFEEKWKALYADAKLGDLPDPKSFAPEGLVTGLTSDQAHENLFKANAAGITTQLSGAHVIGGTAHLWTDKNPDGSTNMHGEMYMGPKMQETLNTFFSTNASDLSGSKAQVAGFDGTNSGVDQKFLAAVKTINAHVNDGAYNENTMQAFKDQLETMKADLAEWNSTLESNTSLLGVPSYKFASGTQVPMEHLDQYKMMADSYMEKSVPILEAFENKTTTGQYTPYAPVKIDTKGNYFTKEDGSVATPIQGNAGKFLIKDGTNGTVHQGTLSGEWSEVTPETTGDLGGDTGIKITKRAQTHEQKATWENGVKTTKPGTHAGAGAGGTEWEIELPTGEKIFYRNSGLTNTAQAQHGKMVFSANGIENESQSQEAMARIMDQLNSLGINTDAQTETDAELTYWREMYGILASRNHTKQSNKAYENAAKDMAAKQKELGGDENHFLETLDEKLDPEEQAQFWRDLWAKHFGQDKVDDLIANRKYLPEFAHQDYDNPDLATGKPMFYRFDVDMDALMKNDWMLATSTGGDPWERFKSGGLLAAEERMRQLDLFVGASGGYGTAVQDQQNGGSHYIYTRLTTQSGASGYNVIYSPRTLLKTRTASYDHDAYGNVNKRKSNTPSDITFTTKKGSGWMSGGSNETDIPHSATLLDDVEILAFDNPVKLNEAIQELKKRGIDKIRGVPVEERLVLHSKMADAIAKMKARWAKGEY